jgi:acyl carrier protein
MTDKEKLAMLEEIFEMDEGSLKATDKLDKLDCWDSMAALSLIVLVSDNFGKKTYGRND